MDNKVVTFFVHEELASNVYLKDQVPKKHIKLAIIWFHCLNYPGVNFLMAGKLSKWYITVITISDIFNEDRLQLQIKKHQLKINQIFELNISWSSTSGLPLYIFRYLNTIWVWITDIHLVVVCYINVVLWSIVKNIYGEI